MKYPVELIHPVKGGMEELIFISRPKILDARSSGECSTAQHPYNRYFTLKSYGGPFAGFWPSWGPILPLNELLFGITRP